MCFKVLVHIPILLSLPSPPFNRHLSLLTFSEGYAQHCRRRASAVSRLPPFVFVSNFMMLPPGAETCRSTLNMRVLSHPAREAAAPLLTPRATLPLPSFFTSAQTTATQHTRPRHPPPHSADARARQSCRGGTRTTSARCTWSTSRRATTTTRPSSAPACRASSASRSPRAAGGSAFGGVPLAAAALGRGGAGPWRWALKAYPSFGLSRLKKSTLAVRCAVYLLSFAPGGHARRGALALRVDIWMEQISFLALGARRGGTLAVDSGLEKLGHSPVVWWYMMTAVGALTCSSESGFLHGPEISA